MELLRVQLAFREAEARELRRIIGDNGGAYYSNVHDFGVDDNEAGRDGGSGSGRDHGFDTVPQQWSSVVDGDIRYSGHERGIRTQGTSFDGRVNGRRLSVDLDADPAKRLDQVCVTGDPCVRWSLRLACTMLHWWSKW